MDDVVELIWEGFNGFRIDFRDVIIYPDDIRNGFDGLLEKIELVK